MVKIENISKTFVIEGDGAQRNVEALKGVSLSIADGEIYGIIGLSGAGKSTLVRCINLLERPDSGSVLIDDVEMTALSEPDLRKQRSTIGMIFQQFNLMPSRTVFENIAYPLKRRGMQKSQINARVRELLELVDLNDKIFAYPGQLSGGQKQRVAIARALANEPKLLLCDEATSALDPATTLSILHLLKKINQALGLTVIIITHEMAVVKEICSHVAVISGGEIIEQGEVLSVFSQPVHEVTKSFVESTANIGKIYDLVNEKSPVVQLQPGEQLVQFRYLGKSADKALISQVSRRFNVDCNVIFGNMEIIRHSAIGTLVLVLSGEAESIAAAISYLSEQGVKVEVIDKWAS